MAKLKSGYRPKSKLPAENPADEIPLPAAVADNALPEETKSDTPALEPKTETEYRAEVSKADEAATRLREQLAAIQQADQFNRQAAQMAQHVPLSREQKLDLWRQKGMPEDQAEFLEANPEMIDHSELAAFSANEAVKAGHERGSAEHMRATKELFDRHMEHLKTAGNGADHQPTPEFFRPPPPPRPPSPPSKATIVSAPVSRNGGPSGEYGAASPTDPNKVHLSREEVEIAMRTGITTTEYARQKLRMLEAKSRGEIV